MATLLDTLKKTIKTDGRPQRQLAVASGVDVAAISRFLAGERGLSVEAVEALAAVLGYEVKMIRRQTKGKGR